MSLRYGSRHGTACKCTTILHRLLSSLVALMRKKIHFFSGPFGRSGWTVLVKWWELVILVWILNTVFFTTRKWTSNRLHMIPTVLHNFSPAKPASPTALSNHTICGLMQWMVTAVFLVFVGMEPPWPVQYWVTLSMRQNTCSIRG